LPNLTVPRVYGRAEKAVIKFPRKPPKLQAKAARTANRHR